MLIILKCCVELCCVSALWCYVKMLYVTMLLCYVNLRCLAAFRRCSELLCCVCVAVELWCVTVVVLLNLHVVHSYSCNDYVI